jgi:hypothetical protein
MAGVQQAAASAELDPPASGHVGVGGLAERDGVDLEEGVTTQDEYAPAAELNVCRQSRCDVSSLGDSQGQTYVTRKNSAELSCDGVFVD